MRTILVLYILFILAGCSKDKGNYDYKQLNDAVVTGIKTGSENADAYDIVFGDKLVINPVISRTMSPDEDLNFTWVLGKDTISTAKNLNVPIKLAFGRIKGRFTVTDNKNGMKYFTDFTVNVTSPYGKGYFIMAEKADGTTMLSFKSLINLNDPIVSSQTISGVPYGKKPVNIMGSKVYKSGPNDYKWQVYITSEEGDNPSIFTDLTSFLPQRYINSSSIIGNSNHIFKPTFAKSFTSTTINFFISQGKLLTYQKSALYRPAAPTDPDDYQLAPWIGTVLSIHQSNFIGYDQKNERFRHFSVQPTDVIGGIDGDRFTFDRITEIPGWRDKTKGQKFFAGGSWNVSTTQTAVVKAILKSSSKLYFYTLAMVYKSPAVSPYIPTANLDAEISIPTGFSANSAAILSESTFDWYIGAGNKIYMVNSITPALNELITLPANAGEITAIKLLTNDTQLLVATYNSSFTGENKGSLYKIDIATKTVLEASENITGKPKDIFIAD